MATEPYMVEAVPEAQLDDEVDGHFWLFCKTKLNCLVHNRNLNESRLTG